MHGHCGFDQTRETRGGFRVADVRLDRPHHGRRRIGPGLTARAGQNFEFGRVADSGASAMTLAIGDTVRAKTRATIRAPQSFELPLRFRSRDAAAAIRRNSPAANHGVNAPRLRDRVLVPHQHHKAAALARPEARRAPVEDAHFVGGQRAGFRKTDDLEWVEAQIHAARQRNIQVAARQRRAGICHREQRGSARAVHRVTAAFEIELIADAPGDGVGKPAGERFLADGGKRRFVFRFEVFEKFVPGIAGPLFLRQRRVEHAPHVGPAQPHEVGAGKFARERVAEQHAGGVARQSLAFRKTRVRQRLGRHVQREPVRQVRRAIRAAHDAERHTIKFVAFNHRALEGVGVIGSLRIGGKIIFGAQPLGGQASERAPLREHVFPQFARRPCIRIDAGHADDGDGRSHEDE